MNLFNAANPDELLYKLRSQEKPNHYSNDQTILFQEALKKLLSFQYGSFTFAFTFAEQQEYYSLQNKALFI